MIKGELFALMEWLPLSDELRRMPFVRLVFPFVAGIITAQAGFHFSGPILWLLPLLCFLALFLAFVFRKSVPSSLHGITLGIFLFVSGLFIASTKQKVLHESVPGSHSGTFAGSIVEADRNAFGTYRTLIRVRQIYQDSIFRSENFLVIASLPEKMLSHPPGSGEWIVFSGQVMPQEEPQNPEEFNYRNYLFRKGISGIAKVENNQFSYLDLPPSRSLKTLAEKIRARLKVQFSQGGLEGNELAVVSALVLGDRSDVPGELLQSYSSSGAMHILAVSGLHVGVIYLLINYLLGLMKRMKGYLPVRLFIGMTLLWSYAILTGGSSSVLRATTMFSFVMIGKTIRRNVSIYNSIAASAFLILLLNPMLIADVGFQLSYAALLAIVSFYQPLNNLWIIQNRLGSGIWSLMCLSITAQLGTFPLSLLYFHQFPNWFLLTNILVVPLASVILYLSVIFVSVSWLHPLGSLFGWMLDKSLHLLNGCVRMTDRLPHAVSTGIPMDQSETLILYAVVLIAGLFLVIRNYRMLLAMLVALSVFFIYRTHKSWRFMKQRELVVYSVYGASLMDIVHGDQSVTLVSTGVMGQERLVKTKAIPYRMSRRFRSGTSLCLDSIAAKTFGAEGVTGYQISPGNFLLSSDQKLIAVLGSARELKKQKVKEPLEVDCIILRKQAGSDLGLIRLLFHAPYIVSDRSFPVSNDEKIIKAAENSGIPYFSVRLKGGFTLGL